MARERTQPSAANEPLAEPVDEPRYVRLLDDWRDFRAGRVIKADRALIAILDEDKAQYRDATPRERQLGGHPG